MLRFSELARTSGDCCCAAAATHCNGEQHQHASRPRFTKWSVNLDPTQAKGTVERSSHALTITSRWLAMHRSSAANYSGFNPAVRTGAIIADGPMVDRFVQKQKRAPNINFFRLRPED
eukprot:2960654-Amphidinium_carterae.1